MPPTTIHDAPALDSYTPLAEHQSQTPTSFYSAKPVLHFHVTGAKALAPRDQLSELPIYIVENGSVQIDSSTSDNAIQAVDIYVSSESLILFNVAASVGISIPYPSISLHAIQRLPDPAEPSTSVPGVYMQLSLSSPSDSSEDEEPPSTDLTILLPIDGEPASDIPSLFAAISACADLHPDPQDADSDEDMIDDRIQFEGSVGYQGISGLPGAFQGGFDGSLPPPFPGSGGWITAENVGEYFDADGNFIGATAGEGVETPGDVAGRVRNREDAEGEEVPEVNGHGEDADAHKRARIS